MAFRGQKSREQGSLICSLEDESISDPPACLLFLSVPLGVVFPKHDQVSVKLWCLIGVNVFNSAMEVQEEQLSAEKGI